VSGDLEFSFMWPPKNPDFSNTRLAYPGTPPNIIDYYSEGRSVVLGRKPDDLEGPCVVKFGGFRGGVR
jgi:hypothetical protein